VRRDHNPARDFSMNPAEGKPFENIAAVATAEDGLIVFEPLCRSEDASRRDAAQQIRSARRLGSRRC